MSPYQLDLLDPMPSAEAHEPASDPRPRHQQAPWLHPQGTHELVLPQTVVRFQLLRVSRRSIGIVISPDGLVVRAPRWVGLAAIESALQERGDWIARKLADQHERGRQLSSLQITWAEGGQVPWLGAHLTLRRGPTLRSGRAQRLAAGCDAPSDELHLGLPPEASAERWRDVAHAWMQAQARAHFAERVQHFQQKLGVQVRQVKLSSARTRWGSASADGTVRLHWKLMHFSPAIIDYVVAHELAHLQEMNHSPRFWAVVRSVLPEVDDLRRQIRQLHIPE